jgi:hypothetical protein
MDSDLYGNHIFYVLTFVHLGVEMKPCFIVYKNDFRIGQGVSWHKALDVLCKQEGFTNINVTLFNNIYFVRPIERAEELAPRYKIIKEN